MCFNIPVGTGTQQKVAALRRILFAVGIQRYAL
jgi:hypothetical protein